jgi:hypothetical protein
MAWRFPTMDQWHMKSVPLPLLDGLDLRYHPGLRYLKCTICKIFVNPKSAVYHACNCHWWKVSPETRKQIEAEFANPEWTKPYPQLPPGVLLPPIDDLPIIPGYRCILDDCGYINDNVKSMHNHLQSKHYCQPSDAAFVEANITKLLISNPPAWIAVSGEVTATKLSEVKPYRQGRPSAEEVQRNYQPSASARAEQKQQVRKALREPTLSPTVPSSQRAMSRSPSKSPSKSPSRSPQRSSSGHSRYHSAPRSPIPVRSSVESVEAGKCPSFEEWQTPCVEHSVLTATGQPMLLHPGLGLIKCGICHLFLLPTQVHGHYKTTHQLNITQPAITLLTETFPNPTWQRPFPDVEIGTGFVRIEGMPVITSIQCTFNDCGAIRPSMDSHRTHFTTAHPHEPVATYRKHTLNIHASRFMYSKERTPIWIPIAEDDGDVDGEDHADEDSIAESDGISRELHASLDALENDNPNPLAEPSPPIPAATPAPRKRVMAKRSKPLPSPAVSKATPPVSKATPPVSKVTPPVSKSTPPVQAPTPRKATPVKVELEPKATPASKRKAPAALKRKRSAMDDESVGSRKSPDSWYVAPANVRV